MKVHVIKSDIIYEVKKCSHRVKRAPMLWGKTLLYCEATCAMLWGKPLPYCEATCAMLWGKTLPYCEATCVMQ